MGRPSRLVLGKKFFWIWFIYALEGIVLALQFFFDKVSHLKHPNVHCLCNSVSSSFVSTSNNTVLHTVGGGRIRGPHAPRHHHPHHGPPGGGGGHYARRPQAPWDHNHHPPGGSGAPSSLSNSSSSVYYLNGYQGIPRSVLDSGVTLKEKTAKLTRHGRD